MPTRLCFDQTANKIAGTALCPFADMPGDKKQRDNITPLKRIIPIVFSR
jgi:hypothetical protein